MRRFRIDALPALGERVRLDAPASHHLLRVLRASRGTRICVFDGRDGEVEAELVDVEGTTAVIEGRGAPTAATPTHRLHLVLGLPKGPAADLAVRMATEAGATDIHLVLTRRSVATGDRVERWTRIVSSAAQQCGRADVPVVHPVVPLRAVFERLPDGCDRRLCVPGGPRLPPAAGDAAVLVGPEGGLADDEVELALGHGFVPMGLGAWVLRADTAAAVAVALAAPAD